MLKIKVIVAAVVLLLGISGMALASGHGPGFLDGGFTSISGSGQNELSDAGAAANDQYPSDSDDDDMDDAAEDQYADDDDADEVEIDDDADDDDADEIDDADEGEVDDDADDDDGHRAGPPAPQAGGSQSQRHDSDDHGSSYEHSNQGSQQGTVTGAHNSGGNSGSSRSRDHGEEDD